MPSKGCDEMTYLLPDYSDAAMQPLKFKNE